MKIFSEKKAKGIKLSLAGLLAGTVNGLLGAGGGIIIIYALNKIIGEKELDKNGAFATALCIMLPISVLSVLIYSSRGHISMEGFGVFLLPAIIGGALGGVLLGKLNTAFLKKLFAGLVIISGILLLVR
ncbi:MAG: sulfite exporter TauE/SafE family protein [Ruminococcaceae bacterium]|nr:sulfite exporter TauE/SafE family protein [Oscillospiraceae bacterium]